MVGLGTQLVSGQRGLVLLDLDLPDEVEEYWNIEFMVQ